VCVHSRDVFMVVGLCVFILHIRVCQCLFRVCVFILYLFDSVEIVVFVCIVNSCLYGVRSECVYSPHMYESEFMLCVYISYLRIFQRCIYGVKFVCVHSPHMYVSDFVLCG